MIEDVGEDVTAAVPVAVPDGVAPLLPVIDAVRDAVIVDEDVGVGELGAHHTSMIAFFTFPLHASGSVVLYGMTHVWRPRHRAATNAAVRVVLEQVGSMEYLPQKPVGRP